MEYKPLTNESLVVGASREWLKVDSTIAVSQLVRYQDITEPNLRGLYKAAHYLGVILHKEPHDARVFMSLGVYPV
ncbi:flagellar hook-basal body protein [Alicyclobacillus hesperidum URH17-3-68]|nr:flagellar hook-basal body protein [Alicyclobacillus hesperidum URH17-3-68]